ncbi:phosphodiesterase [candidate division LCP-89 bacterium B3_LCP]|uniref:Phosphodiesterase n=1 Tax=candidate division LCP-89 bacterium B3_LCP TaxID=2012998 RepID=A0A532V514_UNCL8|nr:MAG: phosphodiesterase [candidate division LCP-89 bacterium B3_LCP]
MNHKRVLVIGLDCFTPQFVFDQWKDDLPNLKKLMDSGTYGLLESTIPAITVPAWQSMMTSKNPGKLGFYGFRNRANHSYDEMFYANSLAVKEPTVWDLLSKAGKQSVVMSVPQTYPPKPIEGCLIGCFLTPDTDSEFTYPAELKKELWDNVGEYIIDVKDFRTDDKVNLIRQIWQMTARRFATVRYLMDEKPWDFFMFVEMGPDRIHHGMWKYVDPEHPKYEKGNRFEGSILNYYKYLDEEIGTLLGKVGDETLILVVSDHGAKKMDGGINFNDWLIREGYLTVKEMPSEPKSLKNDNIDWSKTSVWGSGGYYGRLFLNVKGREPEGQIDPADYDLFRDELIQKIEALTDPDGNNIGTKVFKPEETYPVVNGIAPDLIVYFGDLNWRSLGSIGNPTIWSFENDTGPDDANHAQHGLFIKHDPSDPGGGRRYDDAHLMDIAPTVLDHLGVQVPEDFEGKIIK